MNDTRKLATLALSTALCALMLFGAGTAHAAWPVTAGGAGPDGARAMTTDGAGDIVVTGDYTKTAHFGAADLDSAGLSDVFVAKYDSTGAIKWLASAGGSSVDSARGITVDDSGNVYVVGRFSGHIKFRNPIGLALELPAGTAPVDAYGDIFVAKLSKKGEWLWVRQVASAVAPSANATDIGYGVAVLPGDATAIPPAPDGVAITGACACPRFYDKDGNQIATTTEGFKDTICGAKPSILVAKLSSEGEWGWALTGGTSSTREWASAIAVSKSKRNVYVSGPFHADLTLPGPDGKSSTGDDITLTHQEPPGASIKFYVNYQRSLGGYITNDNTLETWVCEKQPGGDSCRLLANVSYHEPSYYHRSYRLPSDLTGSTVYFEWRAISADLWPYTPRIDDVSVTTSTGELLLPSDGRLVEDFTLGGSLTPGWNAPQVYQICCPSPLFCTSVDAAWAIDDVRSYSPGGAQASGGGILPYVVCERVSRTLRSPELTLNSPSANSFVAKITSTATTSPRWGWATALPPAALANAIAVDANELLYLTGETVGLATFSDGPDQEPGTAADDLAIAGPGAFTAQLDGSTDRDFTQAAWKWARILKPGQAAGTALALGSDGSVYSAGNEDNHVFVDKSSATGVPAWLTTAGDTTAAYGIGLATVPVLGEKVYLAGDFAGTGQWGEEVLPASGGAEDHDAYVAQLNAGTGVWFKATLDKVSVGQAVTPPVGVLDPPDPVLSKPEITITSVTAKGDDYFFWSQSEMKLYATWPAKAELRWRTSNDPADESRLLQGVETSFPTGNCSVTADDPCVQLHIAGAPTLVDPPNNVALTPVKVITVAGDDLASNATYVEERKEFNATTPGMSVLMYTKHPSDPDFSKQAPFFEIVRTVAYNDVAYGFVDNAACSIGSKLDNLGDEPGKTGFLLFEKAYYDGEGADKACNRTARTGTIIPVNKVPSDGAGDDLMAVAWYKGNLRTVYWPAKSVRYDCQWPASDKIVIASELGSDLIGVNGAEPAQRQPPLDPAVYPSMRIYNQPDRSKPGYNPNDEHALFAPSNAGTGFNALFALRADADPANSGSQPYVLLKYWNAAGNEWAMKVYQVTATGAGYSSFTYKGIVATPIFAPYPVRLLGNCPQVANGPAGICADVVTKVGTCATADSSTTYFQDYKGASWSKAEGPIKVLYYYPLMPDFYFADNDASKKVGDCIPWMDRLPNFPVSPTHVGKPIEVSYDVKWPPACIAPGVPAGCVGTLLVGETLVGHKRDLVDIVSQAAAEVIYDQGDPSFVNPTTALAQLIDPLSPRIVDLSAIPDTIATANDKGKRRLVANSAGTYKLPYSISSRVLYDPIAKKLSFAGIYDDSEAGEPLILLNVMTAKERDALLKLTDTACPGSDDYTRAICSLYDLTRNPQQLRLCLDNDLPCTRPANPDQQLLIGLQDCAEVDADDNCMDDGHPEPLRVTGLAPALTAGAAAGTGYVTVAFNNDATLNPLPVSLNVIKVDCIPIAGGPYQGDLKIVEGSDLFDERLTLRHSGDFGARADDLDFEWWRHPTEGGSAPTTLPGDPGSLWTQMNAGDTKGKVEFVIEGANETTLSDNWIYVRYKGLNGCTNTTSFSAFAGDPTGKPLTPSPKLAEGWIKRVIKNLNPYEARVKDFHSGPVNTYASMLVQLGGRYTGDIALNNDPDNLNKIGLIEAYETVLRRGMKLSVDSTPPVNYQPANDALLLISSRIAEFYRLLGNEGWADAADPMIGFGTDSGIYGTFAPAIYAFQNQLPSLLDEELALLRGTVKAGAVPFYNRLVWNFTTGEGELAYQQAYNISDQNIDGVIDEKDARILFPQGHGDAWGHYLTALTTYYRLLQHENYAWVPRAEAVNVGGTAVTVDFLDERKFAQAAAAEAKAGAQVVGLTYRQNYVEDPAGQWQGYKDKDADRAWGLAEWGTRAGQSAYINWIVANALLPEKDGNPAHTGIERVDRTTVPEISEIQSQYDTIQTEVDKADKGVNPLGLAKGVVPFDIDPALVAPPFRKTHFEQIYDRATTALSNAVSTYNHASKLTELLRRNQDSVDEFYTANAEEERDFNNRLIEIFGYPYSDDIGPTGTYPAGYDGPDLYHYWYIDQSDLTGTADQPVKIINGKFAPINTGALGFYATADPSCDNPFGDCSLQDPPAEVLDVEYTVADRTSTSDFLGIIKPPEWTGQRRAGGDIAAEISEWLVSINSLRQGLTEYDNLIEDIKAKAALIKEQHNVDAKEISIKSAARNEVNDLNVAIGIMDGVSKVLAAAGDAVESSFKGISGCIPKVFIAGFAVGGDLTSVPRCLLDVGGDLAKFVLKESAAGFDVASNSMQLAKEDVALQSDLEVSVLTKDFELQQQVKELEALLREEPLRRLEVYSRREVVDQHGARVMAIIARGERILEELVVRRTNAAADVQAFRYRDMAFRVFRNDALQKYHAQFDLAARYAYLAATAYDYETNLLGSDAQSGQDFLTNIVRQRSIGQILDGQPVAGSRGLADALGRMRQNFDVLKGQLGFNNPQTETNRFSLRSEAYRIKPDLSSDEGWRTKLTNFRVANLWDVPEFRRYCRPFAPESKGAQPGLVIPFTTTVTYGLNFFGQELGPDDSAYDPTNFATRIASAGVWLDGYDGLPLAKTPRVYLVPVGNDVLRSPSANDFATREWFVVDQVLPVPFPMGPLDLANPNWIPQNDAVSGAFGDIRRMSSFRAYALTPTFDPSQVTADSRLIGRSVWNSRWLLIIPGGTLLGDPTAGLDTFIKGKLVAGGPERDMQGVKDIRIFFQTYGYSGN